MCKDIDSKLLSKTAITLLSIVHMLTHCTVHSVQYRSGGKAMQARRKRGKEGRAEESRAKKGERVGSRARKHAFVELF